jgi:hypothetical protein
MLKLLSWIQFIPLPLLTSMDIEECMRISSQRYEQWMDHTAHSWLILLLNSSTSPLDIKFVDVCMVMTYLWVTIVDSLKYST